MLQIKGILEVSQKQKQTNKQKKNPKLEPPYDQ